MSIEQLNNFNRQNESESADHIFNYEELMSLDGNDSRDLVGFNEDNVANILERNNEQEINELKKFWQANNIEINDNKLNILINNINQRREAHDISKLEIEQRKLTNPEFNELEKKLGIYIEQLEPQVRQAVVTLNEKGYETYGSGFFGLESQSIYSRNNQFSNYYPSDELISFLKDMEVSVDVLPKKIVLHPDKAMTIKEWTEIWDKVVADLPTRQDKNK